MRRVALVARGRGRQARQAVLSFNENGEESESNRNMKMA